jgi:alkanesulfonate monooxygenase SsuD/methylene tetrahydromethanopterin reductase-like flavin-dependent oxidoreductase (luciferase family)
MILPNVEKGAADGNRSRRDVELTCAIFVVTGNDDQEIENNKLAIKQQIAFYGSTPTYAPVFALHGWQDIGEKLNTLSRQGQWIEMAEAITDDMLSEFAVIAPHDQLARRVRDRYEGLLDRIAYYFPFEPGTNDDLWRDAVAVIQR